MPNIREYENPIGGLTPDNRASVAYAYAGRSIAQSYDDLGRSLGGVVKTLGGAYVQHQTRKEISEGSAAITILQDELRQDWQGKARDADLNDDGIVDEWREGTLEPALQGFIDSFNTEDGRLWAEQQVASTRQRFYERTAADQATRSGAAVAQNLDVMRNRATNMVMNDPASLNATLGLIDSSIQGLLDNSPGLSVQQSAAMQTEIAQEMKTATVKAAVIGMIEQDPVAARAQIATTDFGDYLTSADVQQLDNYAEQQIRQREEQARMDTVEQRRIANEAASVRASEISASIYSEEGTLRFTPDYYTKVQEYSRMPGADSGTVRALMSLGRTAVEDAAAGRPPVDDPNVYASFTTRMSLPPGHPNALTEMEIYQAQANRQITPQSSTMFRGAISPSATADPARRDLMSAVGDLQTNFKTSITNSNIFSGSLDAAGDQRFGQFLFTTNEIINNALASGMPPAQVRSKYLDPRSPDYLGSLVPQFALSNAQGRDLLRQFTTQGVGLVPYPFGANGTPAAGAAPAAAGAATPRPTMNPGETPTAFTQRLLAWQAANPTGGQTEAVTTAQELLRREEQARREAAEKARREAGALRPNTSNPDLPLGR